MERVPLRWKGHYILNLTPGAVAVLPKISSPPSVTSGKATKVSHTLVSWVEGLLPMGPILHANQIRPHPTLRFPNGSTGMREFLSVLC